MDKNLELYGKPQRKGMNKRLYAIDIDKHGNFGLVDFTAEGLPTWKVKDISLLIILDEIKRIHEQKQKSKKGA